MPRSFKVDFDYTSLRIGSTVEVSMEPSFRDRHLGTVLATKSNGCDVRMDMHDGGQHLLLDCWHVSDSRIAERPDVFDDQNKGVFDLTQTEKSLRAIQGSFADLQRLANMADELNAINQRLRALEELFDGGRKKKRRTPDDVAMELSSSGAE